MCMLASADDLAMRRLACYIRASSVILTKIGRYIEQHMICQLASALGMLKRVLPPQFGLQAKN